MRRTPLFDCLHLPRPLSRRGKSLAYSGTFLALAGLGGVAAAVTTSAAASPAGIAGASQPGRPRPSATPAWLTQRPPTMPGTP